MIFLNYGLWLEKRELGTNIWALYGREFTWVRPDPRMESHWIYNPKSTCIRSRLYPSLIPQE